MENFVIGDEIAFKISKFLKWQYLKIEERIFPDGEILPKIEKEPKINEAILVFQKKKEENVNSYLIKFILLSKKLKEISKKVIGILPYYPYSRQDAVFLEGEPISSLYLAEILEKNLDIFITCNLHEHRKRIANLFKIPAYNFSLFPYLSEFFRDFDFLKTIVVGPDRESKEFVDDFCFKINFKKYIFIKQRNVKTGEIEFLETDFDFKDKEIILIDDILSTGKTLFKLGEKIKEKGAKSLSFGVIHLIDEKGIELLNKLKPKRIITTNTLENNLYKLDISEPLAQFLKEKVLFK